MSVKRQATSELNHDNWDDEDPSDDKNMGQFKAASKEVLEKRVIRTAKRRNPISTESSKSVFSGFGGFNKEQKTSFDFLANLTNGSKNANGSTTTSDSEPTKSSGLFSNKPASNSGGLFGAQVSAPPSKPSQTTTWSTPFASSIKTSQSSLFSATNTDSASKETPFKMSNASNSNQTTSMFGIPPSSANENKTSSTTNSSSFKTDSSPKENPFKMTIASVPANTSQIMFGIPTSSANENKTSSTSNTSPFKTDSAPKENPFQKSHASNPANPTQIMFGIPSSSANESKTTASTTKTLPFKTDSAPKENPFKKLHASNPANPTQSMFGIPASSANESKSSPTTNSAPFKIQPTSSTTSATIQTSFGVSTPSTPKTTPEKKSDDFEAIDENKLRYFAKLRGLNEAVSDWISKHVAKTPLCILTPIFDDYEKYMREIALEYKKNIENSKNDNASSDRSGSTKTPIILNNNGSTPFSSTETKTSMPFVVNNSTLSTASSSSPFAINNSNSSAKKIQDTKSTTSDIKTPGFFAISKQDATKTPSLFGVNNTESKQDAKSSPFGLNADSAPTKTKNFITSTPFGINNSLKQDNKISSPFGINSTGASMPSSSPKNSDSKANSSFALNAGSSPFNSAPKSSLIGAQNNLQTSPENKQPAFSFGIKSSTDSSAPKPSTGFSFGAISTVSSLASTTQSTTASFSFGTGKPFSFSTNNVKQPGESNTTEAKEDEEPPKVEYTPVKEDNSVYEKKCKIFVKKDGNFVDKGVGTLYIKKIEGNAKHQLLVRANTNLGTVLLNLVLVEAIPTQRMGKNNVMMVCIPTPDAKPPPTPILIRVKTGEEADELLATLNKYKA